MPRVLILSHQLNEVIALENILKDANYEVVSLSGPFAILSKLDFEKPDVFLFDPDMPNVDKEGLLETITNNPSLAHMTIILLCRQDDEGLETYCRAKHLHGYYCIDRGLELIPKYLEQFFQDALNSCKNCLN